MRRVRHVVRGAVILYGLLATTFAALIAVAGERWWLVALAAVFAPWWLTPAAPMFLFALLRRWPLGAAALGGAALAWAMWYGPQRPSVQSSTASPDAASSGQLRVATFNLGASRVKWKSLAGLIAEFDADIVGLQEVSDENAAKLGIAVATEYPYRYLLGGGTLGMGLLSRFPFDPVERLPSSWPGRSTLRTLVHTPFGAVTIIVAHPHQPVAVPGINGITAYRQDPGFHADVNRLAQAARGRRTTVLIGDLNLPDRHSGYRTLQDAGLTDALRQVGHSFGFTWPMGRRVRGLPVPALVRIDYIWCSRDVTPVRAWVSEKSIGSDHRPIVADLVIGR